VVDLFEISWKRISGHEMLKSITLHRYKEQQEKLFLTGSKLETRIFLESPGTTNLRGLILLSQLTSCRFHQSWSSGKCWLDRGLHLGFWFISRFLMAKGQSCKHKQWKYSWEENHKRYSQTITCANYYNLREDRFQLKKTGD
jgi:hypothetical protein